MFTEDLSAFFDTSSGFATQATLSGGAMVPVIFDKAYQGALSGLVESTGPQAMAKSVDVAGMVQGSTLTISGTTYTVTGVEPDGMGVTLLQLRG